MRPPRIKFDEAGSELRGADSSAAEASLDSLHEAPDLGAVGAVALDGQAFFK